MNKLKTYIGYISAAIMLCGWIATIIYYGKRLDSMEQTLKETQKNWEYQLQLNGRIEMYIELDSQ